MKALLANIAMQLLEKVGRLAFQAISDWLEQEAENKKIKKGVESGIKEKSRAKAAKDIADILKS